MKHFLQSALLLFIAITGTAQVGYHIQLSPSGSGYALNKDSVYIAGGTTNKANVMLVNPGTKSWEYLNPGNLPYYGAIVMKDKNNGILRTAGSNSLLVTSNAWQTVTTSTASYPYVNKCPAGYYGHYNISSTTYLAYSSNGLNWTNATLPGFFSGYAARNYGNKIVALPASSSFSFMVSTDGGLTYTGAPNTATFTGTFIDFYMQSIDTFLVFMNNTLCKSFDAGVTWTNTTLPTTINWVAYKNKNEFAISSSSGANTFSYTINGGVTWSACITNEPTSSNAQISYLNGYYYNALGFRTNDYGATWDHFYPGIVQKGYAIDFNGNKGLLGQTGGQYTYSTDKGRTLKYYTNKINSNQDMMAAKVVSSGNFYGGDRKGQVYTSNDNGQTWVKKNTETLSPNSVRFLTSVNENTVVLTRLGLPVVSIDAGATFSVVTYATSGGNHLQALKPGTGEMLDIRELSNGWEMRTFDINGATTVTATYTTTNSQTLGAFYMTSNTVGYIMTKDNVTNTNKIFRTTDGGVTFTPKTDIPQVTVGSSAYINSPFSSGIPMFHNFGTDTIIITANYNDYYHVSYDGGNSWTKITPPFVPGSTTYGNKIYRMYFFTHDSYFAITGDQFGPLGLYLNTTGAVSSSIGINELNFDKKKEELVVFPNPSRNENLISLLNMKEETEVRIFNVSGQLVKSVITTDGTFSVENLNAGIYIVRVKEKNSVLRTAKLVIQ